MKTDDLITLLARDNAAALADDSGSYRRFITLTALSLLIVGAAFVALAGLRSDFGLDSARLAILRKEMVVLTAAGAALALAWQLSRPVPGSSRLWLLPVCLLVLLTGWEWSRMGAAGWQARMLGSNGFVCLAMIPLLSALPLATLLLSLRRRAPASPALAGGAAGFAAAAIGATVYALHCTDDSMLFVSLWYGLAALIMAALGVVLGRILLRW